MNFVTNFTWYDKYVTVTTRMDLFLFPLVHIDFDFRRLTEKPILFFLTREWFYTIHGYKDYRVSVIILLRVKIPRLPHLSLFHSTYRSH